MMRTHALCTIPATVGRSLICLAAATLALSLSSAPAGAAQASTEMPREAVHQPLRNAKLADLGREQASAQVRHVANWAVDSGDHGGLPFVVVDKVESRVFVFDAQGRLRGASPALVGAAHGDNSVPGIGSRKISSILPEERTTPAGRFTARMGRGPSGEDILWVDYEGALALHRVVTNVPQERRLQRLQSKLAQDRRITYGCINVPVKFYETVVQPTFSESPGVVYILPESRPPQELFGSYDVEQDSGLRATALR
jgi:hypothetical protein